MLSRLTPQYIRVITRFYLPITALIGLVTAFAVPPTMTLFKNIKTDLKELLPDDHPSVVRMEEVQSRFGNLKNMTLVIETSEPEKLKTILPAFAAHIALEPDVKEVEWRKRAYDFFDHHKLFFPSLEDLVDLRDRIERRIEREKLGDLYISFEDDNEPEGFSDLKEKYLEGYVTNITSEFYADADETIFLIMIHPRGEGYNVAAFRSFRDRVTKRIEDFGLAKHDATAVVHYTGGVVSSTDEYDSLIHDLKIAGIISGMLMLAMIFFYFKGFRAALFIGIPLAIGLTWNFAIAQMLIGNLNVTTSFLFSILSGLGMDFGIHLNARYNEARAAGCSLESALVPTLGHTGRSCITAAATTAAAFLILVINDFKGFSEFGLIAGIGILVTLAAYFLMLPILLTMEERISFLRRKRFHLAGWHLDRIARIATKPALLYTALICIAVSLLTASLWLRFDYNFANFTAKNEAIQTARTLEHRVNPQKASPSVVLVHSEEQARAATAAIHAIRDANPDTLIREARSLYNIVPEAQQEKLPIIREIGKLLDDDLIEKKIKDEERADYERLKASAQANPFTVNDVPEIIRSTFVDDETGEANQLVYVIIKPDVELNDGKKAIALAQDVRNFDAADGNTYHAVSSSIIFADSLVALLSDSSVAIGGAFLVVAFLLLIDFRSLKDVGIALAPLFLSILMMLGIMGLFSVHLNFFNMVVLPIIFGIGVDNGVHFYHRFQEEGYKNIPRVMTTTGGASVMMALTNIAGFAGMVFADHKGLASIGVAAIIGMLAELVVTTFFFPALLKKIFPHDDHGTSASLS